MIILISCGIIDFKHFIAGDLIPEILGVITDDIRPSCPQTAGNVRAMVIQFSQSRINFFLRLFGHPGTWMVIQVIGDQRNRNACPGGNIFQRNFFHLYSLICINPERTRIRREREHQLNTA